VSFVSDNVGNGGPKRTNLVTHVCSLSVRSTFPFAIFHINRVPSWEPAMAYVPSGLYTARDQSNATLKLSSLE